MKWPLMVAPVGGVIRRMPSGTAGNILIPSSRQADRYCITSQLIFDAVQSEVDLLAI